MSTPTAPVVSVVVVTSDQYGSRWRSSQGKSNRVASIWVVSSTETLSTQLKVSLRGRLSSMSPARCRISASSSDRREGATAGEDALRWTSCTGGSRAMKFLGTKSGSWSPMVMSRLDENTWWLVSTSTMSLNLVTD